MGSKVEDRLISRQSNVVLISLIAKEGSNEVYRSIETG